MLHHRPLVLLLLPFLCFPVSPAIAQIKIGNIHVHVTYPDDRAPTVQLKVVLIGRRKSGRRRLLPTITGRHSF